MSRRGSSSSANALASPHKGDHLSTNSETLRHYAGMMQDGCRLLAPSGGGGGCWVLGARRRTALVSGGSRPPGVTPRAPPTRSAPQHAGSPPPREYHHRLVVLRTPTHHTPGSLFTCSGSFCVCGCF